MKTKLILLILGVATMLSSCQQTSLIPTSKIKVTILYPNSEGTTFDMNYYANTHMPMVAEVLGEAMKGFSIDKGIAGGRPDAPIPYLAVGYLYFDSLSAYQEVFGPNAEKIISDIPNYTNSQPIVQISEVFK